MARPFLTARWANLAIVTYAVPPQVLAAHVPAGADIVLDKRHDLEQYGAPPGHTALVSLVAFEFLSTRVMGVRWPMFTNFPEINLRFYVRQAGHRGVMFIREIVPRAVIAAIARRLYNEPYVCAPIETRITQTPSTIEARYTLTWPRVGPQTVRIVADKPSLRPDPSSLDHWIKEHNWGFTAKGPGRAGAWVYEVVHPVWSVYPVVQAEVAFDFGAVYGPDWGWLSWTKPVSVVLAVGSEVAVYSRQEGIQVRWPVRRGEPERSPPV